MAEIQYQFGSGREADQTRIQIEEIALAGPAPRLAKILAVTVLAVVCFCAGGVMLLALELGDWLIAGLAWAVFYGAAWGAARLARPPSAPRSPGCPAPRLRRPTRP